MASYILRFCLTALGWLLFGIFALISEALMPVILLAYPKGQARQFAARRIIAQLWRLFLAYLQKVDIIHIERINREALGKKGQLIIANHPSLLDVLILISDTPEANCIVKSRLWHNPFTRIMIRSAGYIPNNHDEATYHEAIQALQRGETLIIFPEGTRTPRGHKIDFNRAAATIGIQAAKEIRPVAIAMYPEGLKKEDSWYRIPKQPYHYRVTVCEKAVYQSAQGKRPPPAQARKLNQQLKQTLQQESQYDLKNPN